jgi:hypothetical protein
VEWTVHPARSRPGTTAILVAGLTVASWTLGTGLLEPLLFATADALRAGAATLMVGAAFAVALGRWFLPTRYRLNDDGVEATFAGSTRRLAWSRFRSYRRESNGYYLSPLLNPTRFDRFRGLLLLCTFLPSSTVEAVGSILADRIGERGGVKTPVSSVL